MRSALKRESFEVSPLAPELKMLGWESSTRAMPRLAEHVHPDAWEICYIVHGMVDWWVEKTVHEVRGGQVYITQPAERHGGVDAMMHPCELYWLHFALPADRSTPATGLTIAQTRRLRADLSNIRKRTFRVGPAVHECFAELMAVHRKPNDPYASVIAQTALMRLVLSVLREYAAAPGAGGGATNRAAQRVERAVHWMNENLAENFSIDDAAAEAGVSVSRFHAIFVEQTGLTPNEYRTRQRVRRAREGLRDPGVSITTLAMELGFATSQYFATVFKSITGMTPREYQRRVSEGAAILEEQKRSHGEAQRRGEKPKIL